jgi:hypothetical protein
MRDSKSWTVRLAGACECFSEPDENGQVEISPFCPLKNNCTKYGLHSLFDANAHGLPAGTVPPLQIPFVMALLRSGLYTRAEIISATCEVFKVGINRANAIWYNTTKKLKESGIECLKNDEGIRYLSR